MLANRLPPALHGKILSAEEVNVTMEYANEKYATLVLVIMKFQAKSPPFQAFKLKEFSPPMDLYIHTKLRNHLGTEKAAKLIFLFKTVNSNVNND